MLSLVLAIAAAAATTSTRADVVRSNARPELPWVVAVAALDVDVPRAELDKALAAATGPLDDVGATARIEMLAGHPAVVIEGPPEAHDVIVSAARAIMKGARAVLFVDGRTTLPNQGALPLRSRAASTRASATPPSANAPSANAPSANAPSANAPSANAPNANAPSANAPSASASSANAPSERSARGTGAHNGKPALPLAPGAGLLDVEGEALALLVERALVTDARIDVANGGAALFVEPTGDLDKARAALEAAVAAPMATRVVDDLRTRARGRVAERRARAGGWARDMATMWLAFGTIDVDEPADLGSALRARVFPAVLLRYAPSR